ncbi:hypothetical protein HDU97_005698 [Phlyctochytrium planicorne]|nr:hypothetical protein HDU97_005698 [Phlyctochytrium planicorne]
MATPAAIHSSTPTAAASAPSSVSQPPTLQRSDEVSRSQHSFDASASPRPPRLNPEDHHNYVLTSSQPSSPALRRINHRLQNGISPSQSRSSISRSSSIASRPESDSITNASDSSCWDDVWEESWKDEEVEEEGPDVNAVADEIAKTVFNPIKTVGGLLLPAEIVMAVESHLQSQKDRHSWMQTCKTALNCIAPTVWRVPQLPRPRNLELFVQAIKRIYQSAHYASYVEELNLGTLPISDDDLFDVFQRCSNISKVIIHNKKITATPLIQMIVSCPKLTNLNIAACERVEMHFFVTKLVEGVTPVTHAPKIRPNLDLSKVNFSRTRVSNLEIEMLAENYSNLRSLRVTGCKNITDLALVALSRFASNLEELACSECEISENGLSHLVSQNSKSNATLKSLEISKTFIGPSGIIMILRALQNLEVLVATDCKNGDGFEPVIQRAVIDSRNPSESCRKLVDITVNGSWMWDDLEPWLRNATGLKKVNLAHTNITARTLLSLPLSDSIEVLDINECLNLSNDSLHTLCTGRIFPFLKEIHLKRCPGFDQNLCVSLIQRAPHLQYIDARRCTLNAVFCDEFCRTEQGLFDLMAISSIRAQYQTQ